MSYKLYRAGPKLFSIMNIKEYVNGSAIEPGVTYKIGTADANSAWTLISDRPILFKLSATEPTDSEWSNVTEEQYLINGALSNQILKIESPAGKYFVVATNAQDSAATVESAYAKVSLKPLGFDYEDTYEALPLEGDGPVAEGFYKISNLESGKLYSINVSPDAGGLRANNPIPEYAFALFAVDGSNNPKALLAAGNSGKQLVFVATEATAIINLSSTIEESEFFVSIRNFSVGSGGGSGSGFDPASDQNITGAWSFSNVTGLTMADNAAIKLGTGDDAVQIRGSSNGAAVIEGTNKSHLDIAVPLKLQNPVTVDDSLNFIATTGEKMKAIQFGTAAGMARCILFEEANKFLSIANPDNVNQKSLTIDGAGNIWFYRVENHNGQSNFNVEVRLNSTVQVSGVATFTKTINANQGINIPLTVGIPTDTSVVNRAYAAGLGTIANILSTEAYLNTESLSATQSAAITKNVPYASAEIRVNNGAHSTIQGKFHTRSFQWNYSSFAGISFIWRCTGASKLTFGMGRGSKDIRTDLSINSYSMIPGSALAYNFGEIFDITFDNSRDTSRNGYTVKVREIYALSADTGWKVKTTTSFIPASHNEPIPLTVCKVIYMQEKDAAINKYEPTGAIYLMVTGGQGNTLFKIATCRGISNFESGVGLSRWVTDVVNNTTGSIDVSVGNGDYTFYQPGGTNPAYYALNALARDCVESEDTADFADINEPIQ